MIKVSHIEIHYEEHIVSAIAMFLKKEYPYYFEVKCYGGGETGTPTKKVTSKDLGKSRKFKSFQ